MIPVRHSLAPGVLAASFGLVLSLTLARNAGFALGLPLDDAWIHSAFARHLAEHGRWGLFAATRSGGETSLLWPVLLALGERLKSGSAAGFALLLGGACWLLLPGLAGTFARTPLRARLLSLGVGACGPLLFLALSGMETIPAMLLGLTALALAAGGDLRGGTLAAGVATALRPDGVLLLPVLLLAGLSQERRRVIAGQRPGAGAFGRTLAAMAPGVALCATALVLLAAAEGRFPPSTLEGRRWIAGLAPHSSLSDAVGAMPRLALEWARAISADLGWGRVAAEHSFAGAHALRWAWRAIGALALACGGIGILARALRHAIDAEAETTARAEVMLLAWAGLTFVAYCYVLPARGHLGRYQPQVYVAFLLVVVEGIAWLGARDRLTTAARVAAGVAAAVVAGGLVVGWIQAAWLWSRAVATVDAVHVRAARELESLLPPEARVAVFDVGAAAYHHRGEMIDLSGLSDPEVAAALSGGDLAPLLLQRGATHLLMPQMGAQGPNSLAARLGLLPHAGFMLHPVASWTAAQGLWGAAFNYSGNVFPRLQLLRIDASPPPP